MCPPSVAMATQRASPVFVGHRGYARVNKPARNLNPKFVLPDKFTEEVFNALSGNPEIMQALHNVLELLENRGIKLEREPTVAEMWQIGKDKEIIEALKTRNHPHPVTFNLTCSIQNLKR